MSLDGVYPVAQAQAGLVNLQQISDAGLSRQQLRTSLRRGDIQRVLRGVYMVPEWAAMDFDGSSEFFVGRGKHAGLAWVGRGRGPEGKSVATKPADTQRTSTVFDSTCLLAP